MKKRYGVPAALLIALVVAGAAAAGTFYAIWSAKITVEKPKTETYSTTKTLQSGESWNPAAKELDFYLPATYNLKVKLNETKDILTGEDAVLKIDLDEDGTYEEAKANVQGYNMAEPKLTLVGDPATDKFSSIPKGAHKLKVDVGSIQAKDKTMATVKGLSGDVTGPSTSDTKLVVSMEPVYQSG